MRVRNPKLDFSSSNEAWIPSNREIAFLLNAVSSYTAHFETFAIRAMAEIKPFLPTDIARDVDTFIRQETAHKHYHGSFNSSTWHDESDEYHNLDQSLISYFANLSEGSIVDRLAYVEAVESIGVVYAHYFYDVVAPAISDADPAVMTLWSWHFAEEFEHRLVPFRAYHAVAGWGPNAYLRRRHSVDRAYNHMKSHAGNVSAELLKRYRTGMSEGEHRFSIRNQILYFDALDNYFRPRMERIRSPLYHPKHDHAPSALISFLDQYDKDQSSLTAQPD
ncbi:MAG: putative metal-dependent hydrolase [Brevundimonas sp.]|jgi:predicted metal-dependent hydrolase|uniref:metal-dependent hydrolase n=1 Tax=Brevundimonas sp. TaxID=1871086 RepID=UPI0039E35115